jgi:excisionase family DNA binding protein
MPATPTVRRSATPRRGSTVPRNDRQLVFTSSQAAGYLGVSLATIRRWTDAGHVSCYRTPGGQRRFTRDQLDVFITSMHRDGGTDRSHANAARDDAGDSGAKVA